MQTTIDASDTGSSLTSAKENLLLLALPLFISGLMLVVPMIFGVLARMEKYKEERNRSANRQDAVDSGTRY